MSYPKETKQAHIQRFSAFRCVEHHLGALLFFLLALTGLAQKFHDSSWAIAVIQALGGIDTSRLVHRSAGVLFALLVVQHLVVASFGVLFKNWRPSMVINKKDFQDAYTNLRYYFGMCEHPARCDRYDYKQKFEYWGVVLGGGLMVATGFVLWFPTELFHWFPFMPGQIIPAAKAAHTNEAVLAFLVIVIWHIYNAVFSPEVFPLDTTIFSRRITTERMVHEHPLEYARRTGEKLGTARSPAQGEPPVPVRPVQG